MVLIQIMYSEIRNTSIILSCHPPWLLKPFGWFISLSLKGILGLPPHPRRSLSQPGVKSFPTSSGSAPWPVAQGPSHADISRFPSLKNLLGEAERHSSPINVLLLPCVERSKCSKKEQEPWKPWATRPLPRTWIHLPPCHFFFAFRKLRNEQYLYELCIVFSFPGFSMPSLWNANTVHLIGTAVLGTSLCLGSCLVSRTNLSLWLSLLWLLLGYV